MNFCAAGQVGIFLEFVDVTSKRSKDEAMNWKPPVGFKPEDLDILKTIRLVELTEKYWDDDVGGPIDAIQFSRDGTLRWYSRKKNCQDK